MNPLTKINDLGEYKLDTERKEESVTLFRGRFFNRSEVHNKLTRKDIIHYLITNFLVIASGVIGKLKYSVFIISDKDVYIKYPGIPENKWH